MEQSLQKVFLVDDNITILTAGRELLKPYYEVYPIKLAEMLFMLLEKVLPDLILLDIEMPGMNGYEVIRQLKADKRYKSIPVIFLTTRNDEGSELKGFELGAVDYISKPFSPPLLKKRIENQMLIVKQRETIQHHADYLSELVQEKTGEVYALQNAVLHTVADLVEFRDFSTGGHIMRTQLYMEALLNEIILQGTYADETLQWDMDFILPSAQLHDVGKIAISDSILNKPSRLTEEEYEIMQTHVSVGVDAIKRIMNNASNHAFLQHALNIASAHHEKWDGTGYPNGLKGEDIPLEGRAMALVDVYDALVSWRPYKKEMTHEEALKIIAEGRGGHFDPLLTDVFLHIAPSLKKITREKRIEV